jgi:hypothetical protein
MPTGINGPFPFQTREYFDNAGDTNAAKGSTLTFEELDETLLFLSASAASANANAVLEQQVTPTLEVGGYDTTSTLPVGMTFTQFVTGLLTPYQAASIRDLTLKYNGSSISTPREVGNDFDANQISLTANDDSNGAFPRSASISWMGNEGTSGNENNLFITDSILTSTNNLNLDSTYVFNRTTAGTGTISFTVTSKAPNNTTDLTATTSTTYYVKSILAGSSTKLDDNYAVSQSFYDAVVADSNNETTLQANATWAPGGNVNTNPSSNWSYYIYNAAYADPTLFSSTLPNQPINSGWTKLTDITVNNQYEIPVTLTVWRSLQPGGYADGSTLSFS